MNKINGLDHLEGETVEVLAGNPPGRSFVGSPVEMMIAPCRPEHLAAFEDDLPAHWLGHMERAAPELCNEYAQVGLIEANGTMRPVMASGVIVHWRGTDDFGRPCGYGEAWARVATGKNAPPLRKWPEITAHAIAGLDRAAADGIRLIEATVDVGFTLGHRWALRLGFEMACLRPCWGITGHDGVLYRRVRGAKL